MTDRRPRVDDEEALNFHRYPTPGKIALQPTKPMATQRDLSLAYSPGVAAPVKAIAADPDAVYDYTSKGNMVAVISNGTAILGLGDLGAAASKPVMEGKAVLFKRFADVDAIDIEVEENDPAAFVECVRRFGNTFGGINLEDIKGPECFIIEQRLREALDIPVFHDDQHGTAIITAAGIINACELTGRDIKDLKVVVNGAGAAGIAVLELIKAMGVAHDNAIFVRLQRRHLQGPHARHEPVEIGPRRRHRCAHPGRGSDRRGLFHRPVGEGRGGSGHGQIHGRQSHHLRHGQSRSGDHARRRARGAR